MAKEREYDEAVREEVLVHLRLNRGNVLRTAQETGIPRGTIRYWADQERRKQATEVTGHFARARERDADSAVRGGDRTVADSADAEGAAASASGEETSRAIAVESAGLRQRKEREVASKLHTVRDVYSEWLLNPDVVAGTSAKDAAIIVGITTEKIQLLEGKPTQRTEHRVVRYVEPGALRELAGRVIDVPARVEPVRRPAQLAAGDTREGQERREDAHAEASVT